LFRIKYPLEQYLAGSAEKNRDDIFPNTVGHPSLRGAQQRGSPERCGATVAKTSCVTSPPFAHTARVLWIASLPLAKTMSLALNLYNSDKIQQGKDKGRDGDESYIKIPGFKKSFADELTHRGIDSFFADHKADKYRNSQATEWQ